MRTPSHDKSLQDNPKRSSEAPATTEFCTIGNGGENFEKFFHDTYSRMMARAMLHCGHRADAEDAVVQAYADVAWRWDRIDTPEAYLHVTVTRQAIRLATQRRKQWEVAVFELPSPRYGTPEQAWEAKQVLAAIACLPPQQRAVLVWHCLDGLEQKEIAKKLGVKRSTVGVHLHRARQTLAARLGRTPTDLKPGDALVAALRATELLAQDWLTSRLRDTEQWLVEAFEADQDTRARVRTRVGWPAS
jgi:RNA polymerase sigma factor (sigma-70 family)